MSFADLCILIAALLPYASITYGKWLARDTFDNADPRNEQAYSGAARRARAAHANGFETFPLFAVAVLLAEMHGASQGLLNGLAALYIALRVLYALAYIKNKPTLRSIFFILGFFLTLGIFFLPFFVG